MIYQPQTFGDHVYLARNQINMSRKILAGQTGVHELTIVNIEHDRNCNLDNAIRIARYLNLDLNNIFEIGVKRT